MKPFIYSIEEYGKELMPIRQDIYLEKDGYRLPMNIFVSDENPAALSKEELIKNRKRVILFIHGGSWYSDLKKGLPWQGSWMGHNARYFALLGFITLEVTYRSLSAAPLTETVRDLCSAAEYAERVILPEFSAEELIISGDSAGGHLALTTALLSPCKSISSVMAFNPITDCVNTKWCGGLVDEKDKRAVSPLHLPARGDIRYLIMHGDADTAVNPEDSRAFAEALAALGASVSYVTLPCAEHAFILYGYKTEKQRVDEYMHIARAWLD